LDEQNGATVTFIRKKVTINVCTQVAIRTCKQGCPGFESGIFKFPGLKSISAEVCMAALQVGSTAPDFELPAVTGKQKHKVKLSDYRGKQNVVVAFYPLDWSPT